MPDDPGQNEPRDSDVNRSVEDASWIEDNATDEEREQNQASQRPRYPHEETAREATERLGETSDEYGRSEQRDLRTEMTEGQDVGMTNPDIVTEAPSGMDEDVPPGAPGGFSSARERRD